MEVDSYGNMQPTQPIASGLEGVAEQVELREAQIIADEYDEALDSRREQSDLRTGGNYASENALTDSGTPDPNSQIIDMLDRACDHCYEPGGRQVISGNYLTVERDGPRLTVTANDDGRVILERTNNGDIRSSMTPADQAILQNGFDVLDVPPTPRPYPLLPAKHRPRLLCPLRLVQPQYRLCHREWSSVSLNFASGFHRKA